MRRLGILTLAPLASAVRTMAEASTSAIPPPSSAGTDRSERDWKRVTSKRLGPLPPLNDKRVYGGSDKAVRLVNRELQEEQFRPELPPVPTIPRGWTFEHTPGHSYFTLKREFESDRGVIEQLRVRCQLEIKDPEKTYRQDDGERDEPEHFTFTLLINKPKRAPGGLEFTCTSVDNELVVDGLAVHADDSSLENAWTRMPLNIAEREARYRGPYMKELDEDFMDELLAFMDERGINNAFAEFIAMQGHWTEQEEYLTWLRMVRAFADVSTDVV
jgi:hypothetical protein